MIEEPLADLFARAARGELVPQSSATTYPLSEVRRGARGPARAGARPGKLMLGPAPLASRYE